MVGRPHFVVTGCARSGTSFMAKLLDSLGIPCGHERVFRPRGTSKPDFGNAQGDSSWIAAPLLGHLSSETLVLHQVRHPRDVLRSLVGTGFLAAAPTKLRWARFHLQSRGIQLGSRIVNPSWEEFALQHCPGLQDHPDQLSRCAHYWVEWNKLVERAAAQGGLTYLRYRLEDLDARTVERLVRRLESDAGSEQIKVALERLGTRTNSRAHRQVMDFGAFVASDPAKAVATLGERYGYDSDPWRPAS